MLCLQAHKLEALGLGEADLPKDARVCSHHFPDGDATKLPSLTLEKLCFSFHMPLLSRK